MEIRSGQKQRRVYLGSVLFKGLRLTAGRRPTWVCGACVTPIGLGGAYMEQSEAIWCASSP